MKRLTIVLLLFFLFLPTSVQAQRSTFTHTTFAVAVTSSEVLAANSANRNFLYIQNDSDTVIYCKFGAAAVLNQGFQLAISGGSLRFDTRFPTQALNCIHGGLGTKVLLILEGIQP